METHSDEFTSQNDDDDDDDDQTDVHASMTWIKQSDDIQEDKVIHGPHEHQHEDL